jgi:four helix bundle protein
MSKKIEKFEDLECWQDARALVNLVYAISQDGQFAKDFDLKSQFRRASISVMNNIAEGFGRYSNKEFIRFLEIATASSTEVKSMIYILNDLKYINEEQTKALFEQEDKTRRKALALLKYLKNKH